MAGPHELGVLVRSWDETAVAASTPKISALPRRRLLVFFICNLVSSHQFAQILGVVGLSSDTASSIEVFMKRSRKRSACMNSATVL